MIIRRYAAVKKKQDKGVPPQPASLQPQLPAVRAVSGVKSDLIPEAKTSR